MAITAVCFNFSKRVNSTKIPTISDGTAIQITLKDTCSINAPTVLLENVSMHYNYCYIEDFRRYYFMHRTDIVYRNMIQYTLVVDPLASYRSEILGKTRFVIRSASSYNYLLKDDSWMHDESVYFAKRSISGMGLDATGNFVIGVVNNDSEHETINPAAKYYAITPTQLTSFLAQMFDLENYSEIDDLTATYFNPFQYIVSCRWYPFAITDISSENPTRLKYGWYTTGEIGSAIVARPISQYGKRITLSVPVSDPNRDYSTDTIKWIDRDKEWSRYDLYIPSCGYIEIDPCYAGQTLTVTLDVDFNTGSVFCQGFTSAGTIAFQTTGEMGSSVQINQVSGELDFSNLKKTAANVVGGVIASGSAGAIADTVSNFLTANGIAMANAYSAQGGQVVDPQLSQQYMNAAVNSGKEVATSLKSSLAQALLDPTVTSSGTDGARFTLTQNADAFLSIRQYKLYNNTFPVQQLGGMCLENKTLSDLSGYTVLANGHIEISGSIEERNAICNYLEGGFFIE